MSIVTTAPQLNQALSAWEQQQLVNAEVQADRVAEARRQPSSCRVWLDITDDRGRTSRRSAALAPGRRHRDRPLLPGQAGRRPYHLRMRLLRGRLPGVHLPGRIAPAAPALQAPQGTHPPRLAPWPRAAGPSPPDQAARAGPAHAPGRHPPLVVTHERDDEAKVLRALARRADESSQFELGMTCTRILPRASGTVEVTILDIRPGRCKVRPIAGGRALWVSRRNLAPF